MWDRALAAERPALVEAIVDPATPLLPPSLKPEFLEKIKVAVRAEQSELARQALQALERELSMQP